MLLQSLLLSSYLLTSSVDTVKTRSKQDMSVLFPTTSIEFPNYLPELLTSKKYIATETNMMLDIKERYDFLEKQIMYHPLGKQHLIEIKYPDIGSDSFRIGLILHLYKRPKLSIP